MCYHVNVKERTVYTIRCNVKKKSIKNDLTHVVSTPIHQVIDTRKERPSIQKHIKSAPHSSSLRERSRTWCLVPPFPRNKMRQP